MWESLFEYVKAIGGEWWFFFFAVEGVMSVLRLFKKFSAWWFVGVALAFLVIVPYFAWKDLRDQLAEYRGINLSITNIYVGVMHSGPGTRKQLSIDLGLDVSNRGEPTELEHWRLDLYQDDKKFSGKLISESEASRTIARDGMSQARLDLKLFIPSQLSEPIHKGSLVQGWIGFTFDDLSPEQYLLRFDSTELELSTRDVYGNTYTQRLSMKDYPVSGPPFF